MRIISTFHDYYDSAMAYGSDPDAIYQRESSIIPGVGLDGLNVGNLPWNVKAGRWSETGGRQLQVFNKKLDMEKENHWNLRNRTGVVLFVECFVLVAGKAYPVWLQNDNRQKRGAGHEPLHEGLVGASTTLDAARRVQNQLRERQPNIEVSTRETQSKGWRDKKLFNTYEVAREKFLEADFTKLHLDTGAPVIMVAELGWLGARIDKEISGPFEQERVAGRNTPPALILNPRLADLNMAQVLDPASAFQDISQFISGVAPGQQMPMVEISDKYKIEKRGFDPKYGFRTRPKGV